MSIRSVRVPKTHKILQTFLLFVNVILLFLIPSSFMDVKVNIFAWLIVGIFSIGIYVAIMRSLLQHLYYLTFLLFVFVAVYFIQTASGIRFIIGTSEVSAVLPAVTLFLVVHLAALLLPGLLPFKNKIAPVYYISRRSCFVVTLGAVIYTLFVALVVDPFAFFASRQEQYLTGDQSSFIKIIVFTAKIFPYLALIYIFQKAYQTQNRGTYYLLFSLLLIFAFLIANPINSPRYISLACVSLLLVFVVSTIGRMSLLPVLVMISPVAFLILLPLSSMIRSGFDTFDLETFGLYFSGLEFSSFQVLLDAFDVQDALVSPIYSLSAILIVIPRSIWPSKAEGLGDEIAALSGYTFTNTGVIPAFNMFADYSWIGLVVFSLIIGFLMRRATLYDGMSFKNRAAFYSMLFFAQIPMLVRGDFTTYMIAIYSFSVSYEGVLLLSRLKFEKPRRLAGKAVPAGENKQGSEQIGV